MFFRSIPIIACLVAGLWSGAALAQYPTKVIRLIIPLPSGSAADLIGREYAAGISRLLGQPVIVDNKPGAGGNIGAELAKNAPRDGYTMFLGSSGSHASNPALYPTLPYDPVKDFIPISKVYDAPMILAASPKFSGATVAEVIARAKANPGGLNVAVGSSTARVVLQAFTDSAGIVVTPVPYKGSADALKDVMGNQVDLILDTVVASLGSVRGGLIKAIAVSAPKRMSLLPNVPTFAENGVVSDVTPWSGSFVPAGTPREIVTILSEASQKLASEPAYQAKISAMGAEATSSSSDELARFVPTQIDAWGALVRKLGIKP